MPSFLTLMKETNNAFDRLHTAAGKLTDSSVTAEDALDGVNACLENVAEKFHVLSAEERNRVFHLVVRLHGIASARRTPASVNERYVNIFPKIDTAIDLTQRILLDAYKAKLPQETFEEGEGI